MLSKNILAIALVVQTFLTCGSQEKQIEQPQQQIATSKTYNSPSVETLQADKEFCLKTLSDGNSDINGLSPSGKTTLQLLILYFINNFTTEQLIAHALKRGADTNVRDKLERTPLFFVTAYILCPEVFAEKQAALDDSLKAQKNPETKIIEVIAEKDTSVEKNEEKAAEVSTPKITRNPLHDRTLSLAVVELLLAFNADPTVTDADGISPLLLAVSTGDQEMVELFARYGLLERIFQENGTPAATLTEEAHTTDQTKDITVETTSEFTTA
jgi:hypothetical protein